MLRRDRRLPAARAVFILVTVLAGWRMAGIHATPPTAPGPSPIEGGPFDRVVYNVLTHTALAVPGVFRQGGLSFTAPSIQYNDLTQTASTTGQCVIADATSKATSAAATVDFRRKLVSMTGGVKASFHAPAGPGHGEASGEVTCPVLQYDATAGATTCMGGVQFSIQVPGRGTEPLRMTLAAPLLSYTAAAGTVQCSGGISGEVEGIGSLPRAGSLESGPPKPEPLRVVASSLSYSAQAGLLEASGPVTLTESDASARSGNLSLLKGTTLTLGGGVVYSDTSGHEVEGSEAVQDLERHVVKVAGPVIYSDRDGYSVRSSSATLDQRTRTVTFSGDVDFTDKDGAEAFTNMAVIGTDKNGARHVTTGPLRFRTRAAM